MIGYRHNYAALRFVPPPPVARPILSLRFTPKPVERRRPAPIGDTAPAYDLLPRIDRLGWLYGLSDATIGRRALNDPNAIYDLRGGRQFRAVTRARLVAFLDLLEREG
ncbi:hypothetical protein ACFOKF_06025 [Sphingobium rhizovicinum]|uniref:DNA-binding protein n=1 Tax=Sphingobium rhizovicinum TaxID=432308 RepID=A0ABV7NCL9_9SPHN